MRGGGFRSAIACRRGSPASPSRTRPAVCWAEHSKENRAQLYLHNELDQLFRASVFVQQARMKFDELVERNILVFLQAKCPDQSFRDLRADLVEDVAALKEKLQRKLAPPSTISCVFGE